MPRKLVESTFISLDGVISDPQNWAPPYWDDEHNDYAAKLLDPADSLLLGRATYEGFAGAWPGRPGDYAGCHIPVVDPGRRHSSCACDAGPAWPVCGRVPTTSTVITCRATRSPRIGGSWWSSRAMNGMEAFLPGACDSIFGAGGSPVI